MENVPKSVLQSIGFNSKVLDENTPLPHERREQRAIQTIKNIELLSENGYDIVLFANTWNYYRTIQQMVGLAKDRVDPNTLKGMMIVSWLPTYKTERYALLSNAEKLYYARQKFYPETLE